MKSTIIKLNDSVLMVRGIVDYDTVISLRTEGDEWITKLTMPVVDFSEAECRDSSCLALMMAWLRRARQLKKSVRFNNVPKSLTSVASACGVDDILLR